MEAKKDYKNHFKKTCLPRRKLRTMAKPRGSLTDLLVCALFSTRSNNLSKKPKQLLILESFS